MLSTRMRMSAAGYVPAGGDFWTAGGASGALAAYQPKGAAGLAASYINLANPGTYDAAPGVAPTFDTDRGWIYAGAGQLYTNAPLPNSNGSLFVAFANGSGTPNQWFAGNRVSSTNGLVLWYRIGSAPGTTTVYYGSQGTIGPAADSGVLAVAGTDVYFDGVNVSNVTGSFTGSLTMLIGNSSYPLYADIIALALYDNILTAPKVAAVSAAMAAL